MKENSSNSSGLSVVAKNVSRCLTSVAVVAGAEPAQLQILSDVNLSVAAGEVCSIVGASGSGKTTLLGILAGMDSPDNGQVLLARSGEQAQSIYHYDEDWRAALRGSAMGFVFQNFQLIADMSALDNVRLPLELSAAQSGFSSHQIDRLAREWLGRVGLGDRLQHFPRQLSGGEQQRVALARAFANSPDILFADEPTGSLDQDTAATVIELLFELNREAGSTMLLVTHDQQLASRCDSVYRLNGGSLCRNDFASTEANSKLDAGGQ